MITTSTRPVPAKCPAGRPAICAPTGNSGSNIASTVRSSTTNASNARSTTSDANDAEKGTGVRRVSMYARTSSPIRAGRMLFAIIPTAVDRQSGSKGRFGATESRIGRQRRARRGNMQVPTTTARITSGTFAARRWAHISVHCASLNTHHSSRTVSVSPIALRHGNLMERRGCRSIGARELDEVVQFLEQLRRRRTTLPAGLIADLHRAVERGAPAIQERIDRHDLLVQVRRFGEPLVRERVEGGDGLVERRRELGLGRGYGLEP